jgi:hypothetical protein
MAMLSPAVLHTLQEHALQLDLSQLLWQLWPLALGAHIAAQGRNTTSNTSGSNTSGSSSTTTAGDLMLAVLSLLCNFMAESTSTDSSSSGSSSGSDEVVARVRKSLLFTGPSDERAIAARGEWPKGINTLLHRQVTHIFLVYY